MFGVFKFRLCFRFLIAIFLDFDFECAAEDFLGPLFDGLALELSFEFFLSLLRPRLAF